MPRRPALLAFAAVLITVAAACSSGDSSSSAPPTPGIGDKAATVAPSPDASPPPVPTGADDCGSSNALAGWPTTTVPVPRTFACLRDALAAGRPAQMSVITVGRGDSGRQTADGYDIPTKQIVTWRVVGKGELEQITDTTEDGGEVTTTTCSGLTGEEFGAAPSATGCS